jgi:outer membrane protein
MGSGNELHLSLQECIDIALEKDRRTSVSRAGIEIAEAQYRQARSSYYPDIAVRSALVRMDQDPLFIFPEETSLYSIADVLPTVIEANVTIPDKKVKLLDKLHFTTFADFTLPLYTGGLRRGIVQQASAGIDAAREQARRTDLEIVFDVKRMYYGTVLARDLTRIGQEALDRLEVTLELTESLYQRGSGKVKKTDFLKSKVMVESVRSLVHAVRARSSMAGSALVYRMGLPWETVVHPTESEVPYIPLTTDLEDLVSGTLRFNPDWGRLRAGLKAAEGKIKQSKSGHMPKLALMGHLEYIANKYDKGIVSPDDKRNWRVGIGMELPVFAGFRVRNQVREARARLDRLKHQEVLLREGLAIKVKHYFLKMAGTQNQEVATGEALKAARDNRDLNQRAYQHDLVEIQDVIEAQILEA